MRGFAVVTSDDRLVGHIADTRDGYLIVESGHLRKARHPVPREFVHVVDEAAKAFVTVPRRVVMDAPEVDRKRTSSTEPQGGDVTTGSPSRVHGSRRRGARRDARPRSRLGVRARRRTRASPWRRSESICVRDTRTSTGRPRRRCSATGTSTGAGRRPTRPTSASSRKPCSARRARISSRPTCSSSQDSGDLADEVRIRGLEPVEASEQRPRAARRTARSGRR